jgi:hypothetical protein
MKLVGDGMPDSGWFSWLGGALPYLGGGLAGSILTQGAQKFTNWRERPILIAEFGKTGDGSIIQQHLPASNADSSTKCIQQWARVKVKNNGRSTARNVRVIITSISNKTSDFTEWEFDQEVIDCGWSHIDETKIDIPPYTWRFADIFVLEMTEANSDLKFTGRGATNIPGRIGVLSIKVMLTGDNCETTTATLPFRYKGLQEGMIFREMA